MSIELISDCDGCKCRLGEGDIIYCADCYGGLEKDVTHLEEKISQLEDEITGLEADITTLEEGEK